MARIPVARLPSLRPLPGQTFIFPGSTTLPVLKRLRDRHLSRGEAGPALAAAMEVARRKPGMESYGKLGAAFRTAGRYREALGVLRDALRFSEGGRALKTNLHLQLSYTWHLMGAGKRSRQCLDRAVKERPQPKLDFNLAMAWGALHFSREEYPEALERYREAERAARTPRERACARVNQALVLNRIRDLEKVASLLDPAIRQLERSRDLGNLAVARSARAWLHSEEGQTRRALRSYLLAAETFERLGATARQAEVLVLAGSEAAKGGLGPAARRLLDRGSGLAAVVGRHEFVVIAEAVLARMDVQAGDLKAASERLQKAARRLRGRRDWVATLHLLRGQAALAEREGDWRRLFLLARRAERIAIREGDLPRVAEFKAVRARAEEGRGRMKAAVIARNRARGIEALARTSSPARRSMDRQVERLSAARMPVLLVGSPGRASREWARRLHRDGPFVVVPCEQLSHPAADLYGHRKGAWSGAEQESAGWVGKAAGGTLVLEGLDRIPAADQRYFLPVVDRSSRPLGSTAPGAGHYRVVAICEDPSRLVPGLRLRLEACVLKLPGLGDTIEEIPLLVRGWLGPRRRITADALLDLSRRRWKGGREELQAVVERLKLHDGPVIGRRGVCAALALGAGRRS
jgi:tetratricopeptide (TPR) repeat protein